MKNFKFMFIFLILLNTFLQANETNNKKIIYLNSDIKVPFWQTMASGIKNSLKNYNYDFEIYDSNKSIKKELELTIKAIKQKVAGIIISPINSSSCVTVLKLAKRANIPVIIADVGADSQDYLSYVSSNNYVGAYEIGQLLSNKMLEKNWQDGTVGIIAIPQKRINGQERTAGFMSALTNANIKGATIKQMSTWTDQEAYNFTLEMIKDYPRLKAIWLQTSSSYKGVVKALKDAKKEEDIILVTFDAEPSFLQLIPKGTILGSGMQQPYLMGEIAGKNMIKYLHHSNVEKNIKIPILVVSTDNIKDNSELINRNVLGIKK